MPLIKCYNEDNETVEVGVDECGCGTLCGDVYAAAVIWNGDEFDEDLPEYKLINDSKKLTSKRREILSDFVKDYAMDWEIASVDHTTIDEINILQARMLAMRKALDGLKLRPQLILVDGDKFQKYIDPNTKKEIPFVTIEGGDALYQSIACASIIAKVERDHYMEKLHQEYPVYKWNENKGYASSSHRAAIEKYGITPYHRKTFGSVRKYLDNN